MPARTKPQPHGEAIAFIDLQAQREYLGGRIPEAISRVLAHGRFILGPEVTALEEELADFVGTRHAVTCASGTDALLLPLMARGIGVGDAVFVPSFPFPATAEVVVLAGATPVFVDVLPNTFNMDPQSLEAALKWARGTELRPAAIIAVDMFGQPADYTAIEALASSYSVWVLADAAQSFGARHGTSKTGSLGDVAGTSFFPSKPLGCYGDGGAIFTDDDVLAAAIQSVRAHGAGNSKNAHERIGLNSRLDTIQAAILLEKLKILPEEIAARQKIADRYSETLKGKVVVPTVGRSLMSVWAQYTVRLDDRDGVANQLGKQGIPTAIHYPTPLHRTPPFAQFPTAPGGAPNAEMLSREVLSLPMHPYLTPQVQDRIVAALARAKAEPATA